MSPPTAMHRLIDIPRVRLRRLARGPWRPVELLCLAGAAACFAWVGWVWLDGALWQERQMARLAVAAEAARADAAPAARPEARVPPSTLAPVDLTADGPRWERTASAPGPAVQPAPEDAEPRPHAPAGLPAELPGDAPAAGVHVAGAVPTSRPAVPPVVASEVLGDLSIPRLGLRWAVAEGIAARTLRRAPGWIPGTARPGAPGNVGIAGHRDRHFRRLEEVAVGDELVLGTPAGPRRYRVDWVRVVAPSDTAVLAPTGSDALTLVTCFPFRWLGPAPDRYVVRAVAVEG